jgi:branched-chain amino acid transport system substrate-binding protein
MKQRRSSLYFVLAVIWFTFLGPRLSIAADTIKIGTVLSTSGRFAFLGEPEQKGGELAVEEINHAGGILGKKLELVSYDDEGNPAKTATLIDRLINKDKVVGVIGASHTGTIHVVATACEKAQVPQFYISGNSSICQGKKWVFNAAPPDELDAEGIAYFIKNNLMVTKVGVIHDANEYGTRSAESFSQLLSKIAPNTQIVRVEKYQSDDRDMSAQLINLKNAGSQCIVIWGVGFAPAVVVKNWHQLGMKEIKLIGGAGMGSHKMIELLGPAGEGLLFNTVINYGDPNPKEKDFLGAYNKKFGKVPPTFAACGYDGVYILAEAIKRTKGNTAQLSEAIYKIKNFKGVQGTFSFSDNKCNGLQPGCYSMAIVKNGNYYPGLKVYPPK